MAPLSPDQDLPDADALLGTLRETVRSLVRRDGPDLSARQLAVFLICYLEDGPHTVRGLAVQLDVAKSAITRALDRLGTFDLSARVDDPQDGRSVIVRQTRAGKLFLKDLRSYLRTAAKMARPEALSS